MKTHKPLKGIQIGDIGTKLGFNLTDNGYMSFDNVRYPKSILLDQYVKVDDDGTFK